MWGRESQGAGYVVQGQVVHDLKFTVEIKPVNTISLKFFRSIVQKVL